MRYIALCLLSLAFLLPAQAAASQKKHQKKVEKTARHSTQGSKGVKKQTRNGAVTRSSSTFYKDDGPSTTSLRTLASKKEPEPKFHPILKSKTKEYTVFGQTFKPQISLDQPYEEDGHASWYGRRFHGQLTAAGERYDMHEFTAAHPTLPIPSYAKVTNLSNGKSVTVRINDRGPFLKGRLIDLSYAAAAKIDLARSGGGHVRVEKITRPIGIRKEPSATVEEDDSGLSRQSIPHDPTPLREARLRELETTPLDSGDVIWRGVTPGVLTQ